ncbi:MAG: hypothetical protein RLZZ67_214 [Candidatus Parcubacteria bacterium]|jgi:uncharacterized membrane protein YuzA (DUF378 family)
MKALHAVSFILVVVGALNWLLVGLGDWNLVNLLLGNWPAVERVVYVIVGVAGILMLFTHKKDCKTCETAAPAEPMM